MKALLVGDTDLANDNVSRVLESAGYNVIVYKWLLKALDNVEEIAPHLIVISTKDYPRHWKTLTQFASTDFGGYKPQVILYAEGGLDEEETKKAEALNVRGIFESVDVEGLEKLREILAKEIDIYSGKLLDSEGHPQPVESLAVAEDSSESEGASILCSFMFTNPLSLSLVSGYAHNFDGKKLSFKPDVPDFIKNLSEGIKIECAALKTHSEMEAVSAVVKECSDELVLELC